MLSNHTFVNLKFSTFFSSVFCADTMAYDGVKGYIHKVSLIKTSKKQHCYFNAILQAAEDEYQDIVCFSPDRRNQVKSLEETSTGVNIANITKSPAKRKAGQTDIQMDKRAKITNTALNFQCLVPSSSTLTDIQGIKTINSHQQVF